jgi:hypothetical protein
MWKGGVGFTIAHRTTTWTTLHLDRLDLGGNIAGNGLRAVDLGETREVMWCIYERN